MLISHWKAHTLASQPPEPRLGCRQRGAGASGAGPPPRPCGGPQRAPLRYNLRVPIPPGSEQLMLIFLLERTLRRTRPGMRKQSAEPGTDHDQEREED